MTIKGKAPGETAGSFKAINIINIIGPGWIPWLESHKAWHSGRHMARHLGGNAGAGLMLHSESNQHDQYKR